ncbi:GntR family carbon starvation induced transcriptional regulator [Bradyrhizobium sp. GM24.11]
MSSVKTLAVAGGKRTMASILTERLRQDVLSGALKAGARLTMRDLAERYDAGAIPLREALSRLSSTGFITVEDQRGFRVAEISDEEVVDVQTQRAELECIALRKSIETGSLQWEIDLISSYHALLHIQLRLSGQPLANNPDWEAQHCKFHFHLVSACGSKWLLHFIQTLIEHSSRYRQAASIVFSASSGKRDVGAEHKAIVDAAVARDADLACALLRAHHRTTTEYVVEMIRKAQDAEVSRVDKEERP